MCKTARTPGRFNIGRARRRYEPLESSSCLLQYSVDRQNEEN